jgi:hypothetical protein
MLKQNRAIYYKIEEWKDDLNSKLKREGRHTYTDFEMGYIEGLRKAQMVL